MTGGQVGSEEVRWFVCSLLVYGLEWSSRKKAEREDFKNPLYLIGFLTGFLQVHFNFTGQKQSQSPMSCYMRSHLYRQLGHSEVGVGERLKQDTFGIQCPFVRIAQRVPCLGEEEQNGVDVDTGLGEIINFPFKEDGLPEGRGRQKKLAQVTLEICGGQGHQPPPLSS